MTQTGYIKLYRKSMESVVWENANTWKVWSYCLMRANHKETKIFFNSKEMILKPGQFITGRIQGAKDCNMPSSTFWDQLVKLEKLKNIDITSDNKKSMITVVKWSEYQGVRESADTASDINPTSIQHRQECKNDNKKNYSSFSAGGRKDELKQLTNHEEPWL